MSNIEQMISPLVISLLLCACYCLVRRNRALTDIVYHDGILIQAYDETNTLIARAAHDMYSNKVQEILFLRMHADMSCVRNTELERQLMVQRQLIDSNTFTIAFLTNQLNIKSKGAFS